MADSIEDVGSITFLPIDLNWSVDPSSSIAISRQMLQQPGTVQVLNSMTVNVPQSFTAQFTLYSKEDEHALVTFLHEKLGRVKKFWILHPKRCFFLKEPVSTGASALICETNKSYSSYNGYERIWILMNDGDILTRHIFSITYDEVLDKMTINLSTNVDRDITLTNHALIGRALLVRFNTDEFEFKMITDMISEISLEFYEVVLEYDLI